jgi:hypothetical protein
MDGDGDGDDDGSFRSDMTMIVFQQHPSQDVRAMEYASNKSSSSSLTPASKWWCFAATAARAARRYKHDSKV